MDVKFAVEEIQGIDFDEYSSDEFAIAKLGFLSTRPNSHGLDISEDVLRACAPSVLGKWVVCYVDPKTGDATTHVPEEIIVGHIPENQEVEFVYDADGYLRAYVYAVISKIYAKDFCNIFHEGVTRAVSIEMQIETENGRDMNDIVNAFNGVAVTVLGLAVKPSCPQSEIEFVRFSNETDSYFTTYRKRETMADQKTYKIDKSKEALSDGSWSDVDKTELRNKILEAANASELVKAVYLKVDDDWEERPSEALGYPVMEFKGDTLVYNRNALGNALARAVQNDEQAVINKIREIYDDLDIDDEGKEDEAKMSEIEFAAVNIGDLWGRLWKALDEAHKWGFCIQDIYEESNQKFVILKGEDKLWRLDFSLTEEGLTLADNMVEVQPEFLETDNLMKFAEPENVAEYRTVIKEEEQEPEPAEMSLEEAMAKIAEMQEELDKRQGEIDNRDNIIMEKDAELADLRNYKNTIMEQERASAVETVMSSVAEFMDKDTADLYRQEGLKCDFAEIDAWTNKVKASVVDKAIKSKKTNQDFTRMSGVMNDGNKHKGLWDRLKDAN